MHTPRRALTYLRLSMWLPHRCPGAGGDLVAGAGQVSPAAVARSGAHWAGRGTACAMWPRVSLILLPLAAARAHSGCCSVLVLCSAVEDGQPGQTGGAALEGLHLGQDRVGGEGGSSGPCPRGSHTFGSKWVGNLSSIGCLVHGGAGAWYADAAKVACEQRAGRGQTVEGARRPGQVSTSRPADCRPAAS